MWCVSLLVVILLANNSSIIALSWSPPAKQNGVITGYSILCSQSGVIPNNIISQNFSSSQTTARLSRLLPYTNYSCSITAHTSVGGSPSVTIDVTSGQDSELIAILYKTTHDNYVIFIYMQSQVDHLRTCLLQVALILSPSPGLLPYPHNVMESSSAISSPVAQETSSSTLLEPAAPVWPSQDYNHSLTTPVLWVLQQL